MKFTSFILVLLLVVSCFTLSACNSESDNSGSPESSAAESSDAASSESADESSVESSDESSDEVSDESSEVTISVISKGCGYEVPGGKGYVVQDDKWPANYSADLTDGVANDKLTYDSTWFSFNTEPDGDGQANTINNIGTVIIDLGTVKNVTGVKANVCTGEVSASIAPIGSIKVSVSTDGLSYSEPFALTLPTASVGWAVGECQSVSAQFVKVEFVKGGNGFHMFTNEIEVYGN